MGTVKYSKLESSNGVLTLNDNTIYDKKFDSMEYIKIFDVIGHCKVYINNSKDFIYLVTGSELELSDFQINSIKIEATDVCPASLQFYLCK